MPLAIIFNTHSPLTNLFLLLVGMFLLALVIIGMKIIYHKAIQRFSSGDMTERGFSDELETAAQNDPLA